MPVAAPPVLDQAFATELPELVTPWKGDEVPAPALLALNEELAQELELDVGWLASPDGVRWMTGVGGGHAMAYSGHQFGFYSPRLGDGRALLLGERLGRDLHLKGSGRTPYARGGADGKAAVGPMLRELVVGEALHALGIPTTRALAVLGTGEAVRREVPLPGAICVRVAASHIRVGTFQYTAANAGPEVLQRLTDHAIRRHHPSADGPLALLEAVAEAQAALVAGWMLTGFVHGVMNTDNMTISGEAIDFGPCAWMERYDPQTVFSSIDQQGRYAWGNQPAIAQWDLARFAEALLPLGAFGVEEATAVLQRFPDAFEHHWQRGMAAKLGLDGPDPERVTALLAELQAGGEDWTTAFRKRRPAPPNPLVIPRNHVLDDALSAATAGDLEPVSALIAAVRRPFDEGADARLTQPAPDTDGPFVTFCGT